MTATSPQPPGSSALLEPPPAAGGPATSRTEPAAGPPRTSPPPEIEPEPTGTGERVLVGLFVGIPFARRCSPPYRSPGAGASSWHDVVIGAGLLPDLGPRHRGRLPPLLHARFVQGEAVAAHRARHRGQPGHRGPGAHLGGRSPPPPQVLRPRGRPALTLAFRRRLEGADQGPALRPHGLDVRRQQDVAAAVRARPARRPRHPRASRGCSRGSSPPRCCCPRPSAASGRCPGRARSPRSSGPAWSGSRCCTT